MSRTCRIRPGSPRPRVAARRAGSRRSAPAPWRTRPGASSAPTSSTSRRGSKSSGSSTTLPASSLEKSRMSLITLEQRLAGVADALGVLRAAAASSSVSSSSAVSPITPFIGVRISWLIVARNSDFSRDDSSASSRACSERRGRAAPLGDVLAGHRDALHALAVERSGRPTWRPGPTVPSGRVQSSSNVPSSLAVRGGPDQRVHLVEARPERQEVRRPAEDVGRPEPVEPLGGRVPGGDHGVERHRRRSRRSRR